MRIFLTLTVALTFSSTALAQTERCDALTDEKAELARTLLSEIHPYDCCDDTIAGCLEAESECTLVTRLADDVCRLVAAGANAEETKRAISRRAQSMMPAMRPAEIDLDEATRAGDESAPITLVMYACVTCPFCYSIASDIQRIVTEGELKGKVKLYYRSFPLRGHENSVDGALALTAAARMGQFWAYANLLYPQIHEFSTEKAVEWAESLGMDTEEFEGLMKASETREHLAASRREGERNRVTSTPTFFINGRRYTYDTDRWVLIDVLQEEHERIAASSGD